MSSQSQSPIQLNSMSFIGMKYSQSLSKDTLDCVSGKLEFSTYSQGAVLQVSLDDIRDKNTGSLDPSNGT